MLNTVEFGLIRIVEYTDFHYDVLIGIDLMCEWEFWQLTTGEIVAKEIIER